MLRGLIALSSGSRVRCNSIVFGVWSGGEGGRYLSETHVCPLVHDAPIPQPTCPPCLSVRQTSRQSLWNNLPKIITCIIRTACKMSKIYNYVWQS